MRRPERKRGRWIRRLVFFVVASAPFVAVASVAPILALRSVSPPTSAYMLRARSADPATGQPCDHVEYAWVGREAISPELRLAVVLAEDQRFLMHNGFDSRSVRRALREREQGRVRGASTISQQVAKNLFLWPDPSYLRKGIEAWLTFWIEFLWPKQRILEVYLNVAQFGPCVFGVAAASERFFGVAPLELTPDQAALLATVLPNPKRLRAHNPGPYATERWAEILELMATHRGAYHLRDL
ncbi:MAG: monofunctional biosynthetic peptidoglycan transglycosylase [Planctomycetota bacterium]